MIPESLIIRLLDKIDVRSFDECWPWQASTTDRGYGKFGAFGRGAGWEFAHRITYWLFYNTWPTMHVLHTCDNPPCCNPKHLYQGDDQNNQDDAWERGRHQAGRGEDWQRGEKNSRAVLTEQDVRDIRATKKYYGRNKDLAAKYSVSLATIEKILSGETWRHVT